MSDGGLTLLLVAVGVFLVWRIWLAAFPTKTCKRCGGSGAWGAFNTLRTCGRCSGSGRETRFGAK